MSERKFTSGRFPRMKKALIIGILLSITFYARSTPLIFNILDYRAKGDGVTLNTKSIQAAVDACSKSGGGTVLFPAGRFVSGTIYLKSNVTLFLEAGAVLEGSKNLKDYPVTISKVRSYTDNYTDKSLIYAEDLEDISITGKGIIDGNGAWFKVENMENSEELRKKDDFAFYKYRPYLIRVINCKNILVRDITLLNSPMWVQHYLLCKDVNIDGIKVNCRVNHNNDGIDIDACERVRISNCDIISGDDAVVLKSTLAQPCKNVTITNCTLSSNCNAFKMGTETNGGFENVVVSNCTIYDTQLAGITLQLVDGGTLDRVSVSNITMNNVGAAIFIRLGNRARPYRENMAKPGMGKMSNVIIDNIIGTNIGKAGCSITGLPGYMTESISLSNISLTFDGGGTKEMSDREIPELDEAYPEHDMFGILPAYGFYCRHCKNIRFNNMELGFSGTEMRPAILCDDVENMVINSLIASTADGIDPVIAKKSTVFLDSKRLISSSGKSSGKYVNCNIRYADDREIRISSPAGARDKRKQIIRAIWGKDDFPDRSDLVVTSGIKSPLSPDPALARVDRFDIPVISAPEGGVEPMLDLAYYFVPVKKNNRLVILNPGHTCKLSSQPDNDYRIEPTIKGLLQAGFDVIAVFMPHVSETTCNLDHCSVMNTNTGPGDHPATYGLRYFLEPEIVCLNYLLQKENYENVNMVGLSGGGWTTNLLTAIDERIKFSFSVAGSMPLYYRSGGSIGDIEQFLPELYRDIAGYPDLYVLGAYGKGRKQVQILNRNDDCCFGQRQHDPERNYDRDLKTFETRVKEKLKDLDADGHYYLVIDETAPCHQISGFTLNNVILKELNKK